MYICTYINMRAYTYVHMHIYKHACIYICTCVQIFIYAYMYVYTHIDSQTAGRSDHVPPQPVVRGKD